MPPKPYTRHQRVAAFWAKVDVRGHDDCWLWQSGDNGNGYGIFGVGDHRTVTAHRFSWELANVPISDDLCVLHNCDNRRCVNPSHLFLGTNANNSADMVSKWRQRTRMNKPNAKMDPSKADNIRRRVYFGAKQRDLAREYEVSTALVCLIVNGKRWVEDVRG